MNSSGNSGPFQALNRTELYQTCRRAGINVPPDAQRDDLIAYLTGQLEPEGVTEWTHVIDSWRHGIIGFLNDHWATLEPQIKCPAKNLRHPTHPNPRPCFGCLDMQVMACVVRNSGKVEQLIQLHRKPKDPQ